MIIYVKKLKFYTNCPCECDDLNSKNDELMALHESLPVSGFSIRALDTCIDKPSSHIIIHPQHISQAASPLRLGALKFESLIPLIIAYYSHIQLLV